MKSLLILLCAFAMTPALGQSFLTFDLHFPVLDASNRNTYITCSFGEVHSPRHPHIHSGVDISVRQANIYSTTHDGYMTFVPVVGGLSIRPIFPLWLIIMRIRPYCV